MFDVLYAQEKRKIKYSTLQGKFKIAVAVHSKQCRIARDGALQTNFVLTTLSFDSKIAKYL